MDGDKVKTETGGGAIPASSAGKSGSEGRSRTGSHASCPISSNRESAHIMQTSEVNRLPNKETVIKGLKCCLDERQADCAACYQQGPGFGIACRKGLMRDALNLLELMAARPTPRVLAAEEVQHLTDKTVICVEQLLSHEDEERGYITGMVWGVVCNRTNAPDGGLILSMLGTFFPNTVLEIPYKATYRDENTKKRRTAVYRFWTDRPTGEQSKAVKWE